MIDLLADAESFRLQLQPWLAVNLDQGWAVPVAGLGYECGSGIGTHIRFSQDVTDLVKLVRAHEVDDTVVLCDAVATRFVEPGVFRHYVGSQGRAPAASDIRGRDRVVAVTEGDPDPRIGDRHPGPNVIGERSLDRPKSIKQAPPSGSAR